jgi:hypothetical protein
VTAARQTVDLTPYPDLIVVNLGMRVNVLTGNPMPAKGGLFSARDRLRRSGAPETPAPYTDSEQ